MCFNKIIKNVHLLVLNEMRLYYTLKLYDLEYTHAHNILSYIQVLKKIV